MSMLRKIEAGWRRREWLRSLRQSNLVCIFANLCIPGDERADRIAVTAVISDGRAIDHADVLNALREAGKVEGSLRDSESDTMERIRNGQVKLGARYEQYAGSKRRMVKQMRTGTVSRHTLLNVLEG
jgi:hypothetical protein